MILMEMKPPMNTNLGRITRSEKLLGCPYDALELEFGGYKSHFNSQKSKVREEFLKCKDSFRRELLLKKANILQRNLLGILRLKLKAQ